MMQILGLPGDRGPCYLYRTKWPLEAMSRIGQAETMIPTADARGNCWLRTDRLQGWDIVHFQRQCEPAINLLMQEAQERGVKVIFDIDDSITHIPESNPCYIQFGQDKARILEIWSRLWDIPGSDLDPLLHINPYRLAEVAQRNRHFMALNIAQADLVTVSTQALAEEYGQFNKRITVLPNCIEPCVWQDLQPIAHEGIWIGWCGGFTHREDLEYVREALRYFLMHVPQTRLLTVGWEGINGLIFRDFPQDRLIEMGRMSQEKYKSALASADIIIAPSAPIPFNRAKSPNRVLEAWMCKRPVVATETTYGDEVRASAGGGIVADGLGAWFEALLSLTQDAGLRQQMGQRGYEYAMAGRTYDSQAHRWSEAYRSVLV